jgi:16S rRNA processing protein RimM
LKSIEAEYFIIGKIISPHGNKGKVKVEITTDFPERFSKSSIVYLNKQPITIENVEWYRGNVIVKLNTVNGIKDAEEVRGQFLEIHQDQLYQLPEDSYYHYQLIGLKVRTIDGDILGEIIEILPGSSNDNYVVNGDRGDILIPAVEDIVKSVKLEEGILIIEPIDGLLDLNVKTKKRGG